MACVTVAYAGAYAAARSRVLVATAAATVLIAAATAFAAGGLRGLGAVVAVIVLVGAPSAAALFVVVCVGILVWNLVLPKHHVWALPGGRAVLTARQTPRGWKADNASALPVGRGVATPLLDHAVDFISRNGGFAAVSATSVAVAEYYAKRYGATIHRKGPGRIRVEPPD